MKKALLALGAILVVAAGWYLFIKPSDYIINFKVKTTPGTVMQSVISWNYDLPDSEIIAQNGISQVVQQRHFGDSVVNYNYSAKMLNDSITQVSVGVTDLNHSLINRLTVPFTNSVFKSRSIANVDTFFEILREHLDQIKIEVTGIDKTRATYCAYIPLKGLQVEKALGMMQNYGYIGDVLLANNVELNGPPIIEVTDWNMETDSIAYNFCFPIKRSENLPITKDIKYKRLFEKEAIHAVYNGNYITSDRAWYALLEYAKMNDIEVENKPVEIFYNNPNMGGNELNWKADIYLPLKQEKPL